MKKQSIIWKMTHTITVIGYCLLVIGLFCPTTVFAQSEDDEEEEEEATIKQPSRSQLKQANYPTVTLKGMVTDQASRYPVYSYRPWVIRVTRL